MASPVKDSFLILDYDLKGTNQINDSNVIKRASFSFLYKTV